MVSFNFAGVSLSFFSDSVISFSLFIVDDSLAPIIISSPIFSNVPSIPSLYRYAGQCLLHQLDLLYDIPVDGRRSSSFHDPLYIFAIMVVPRVDSNSWLIRLSGGSSSNSLTFRVIHFPIVSLSP